MAKVTSKLQVTIPKTVAEAYGIKPGTEVRWIPAGEAIRVEPAKSSSQPKLSMERRLVLFDRMTKRIEKLPPVKPAAPGEGRGWTRDDLYADRMEKHGRPRRHEHPRLPR
ncbi:MAG: AbrB/MazE/SpoVT family DNA-binding domain-containing protein [Acidobacteria bacterium]|nr:AbrB/MazE/SpoVT family DNA-binding domain-containing protein [Acidobacteriota bacterium]